LIEAIEESFSGDEMDFDFNDRSIRGETITNNDRDTMLG